MEAQIVTNLWY